MANDPDWYEVVQGGELMQGDLLRECPVARVRGFEQWPMPVGQPVEVEVYLEDLVVLSQSCDLANDKIFVLPKPVVEAVARSAGPRLRLRSPYREYIAQAFARYFMRVGLPLDANAFETEGQV